MIDVTVVSCSDILTYGRKLFHAQNGQGVNNTTFVISLTGKRSLCAKLYCKLVESRMGLDLHLESSARLGTAKVGRHPWDAQVRGGHRTEFLLIRELYVKANFLRKKTGIIFSFFSAVKSLL